MGQIFSYIDRFVRVYHSNSLHRVGTVFPVRDRPYMRMYSILSGSSTFYVDGTAYRAGAGDILLFDSGEVCRQTVDPSESFHRIVVNFYPEMVNSFDPAQELLRPPFPPPSTTPLPPHRQANLTRWCRKLCNI